MRRPTHILLWLAFSSASACGSRSEGDFAEFFHGGPGATGTPGVCQTQPEWQRRFDGRIYTAASWNATGVSLAGRHFDEHLESTAITRLSLDGAVLFDLRLDGRSALIASQGDRNLVARTWKDDLLVSLHGAAGAQLNETTIDTGEDDFAHAVLPAPGGYYVYGVAGYYPSSLGGLFVTRLDLGGNEVWTRIYEKPHKIKLRARAAFVDASGGLVFMAQRWIAGGSGPPWVVSLSSDNQVRWEYQDAVTYERGSGWALVPSPDGGVVLAGTLDDTGVGGGPARAIHLNASGKLVWVRSFDDGSGNQQTIRDGVAVPGGGYAFVGYSANSTQDRLWRLRANGSIAWTRDYPRTNTGGMTQIENAPGGFWVGTSAWKSKGASHFEVLRLGADGAEIDSTRADGSGVGGLNVLQADASGRVLAAGGWHSEPAKQGHVFLSAGCR